ncbi:MAG: gliding motility lipoprotein GldH [Bacteroidetes bacterium]|nr:gliding motility lipoprotein GldH [Bacteroidota bacterium]
MRRILLASVLIPTIILVLLSCNTNRFYRETHRIPDGKWETKDKVSFSVNIPDTSKRFSLYIHIRNDVNYPFANIFMFLDTRFPDGRIARDTVECQLADYDGRWLGTGTGSIKYNRFLFQKGVKFKQKGSYSFSFEQAMRTSELNGIRDVGLEIEL